MKCSCWLPQLAYTVTGPSVTLAGPGLDLWARSCSWIRPRPRSQPSDRRPALACGPSGSALRKLRSERRLSVSFYICALLFVYTILCCKDQPVSRCSRRSILSAERCHLPPWLASPMQQACFPCADSFEEAVLRVEHRVSVVSLGSV